MNASVQPSADAELTIRRTLDHPRSIVFRMWTEGENLQRWSCPAGFTVPFSEGDIRPGGSFRTCMRAPDGTEHWLGGTYVEIVPQEKIVFFHAWENADGSKSPQTTVTVTFAEEGPERTRLTLHQGLFQSAAARDGHEGGWSETLDNLENYLRNI